MSIAITQQLIGRTTAAEPELRWSRSKGIGRADEAAHNDSRLPDYAAELAAFHDAFAQDLQAVIQQLPITPEMQVLDVGCGDGFFTGLISDRLSEGGHVIGADSNAAYLELARRRIESTRQSDRATVVESSIDYLPFPSEAFDFVWCAQSLYSLPDPARALRTMRRMVRPGGLVGVLENDTLHQIFLPWPEPLEIALRAAQYSALSIESSRPDRFYVGRRLPALLAEAGLVPIAYRTQCIDRLGPVDSALEHFIKAYLQRLAERVKSILPGDRLSEFQRLISPESDEYLLRQPYFTMSWLNVLALGQRQ